ncbi:preprotein translocase subunit SecG [methane-oxidizing endosymbiont of Gigantopelta aegis]|uniref:preprotein translocase subunit SecG n=1 Tax=methane-oxidizing endosymbiont of Gigantopelta aegis TaxID=2794938 RepID=UPI0018DCE1B8|nr:preprotein translocase subunit SecG [methane-oxidizing endosymbiont of Gigantopelta aegis]
MYQVIIVVHVLLGLSVIGLVLMQHGKGADAGAAFGSGSSGSVFGAQGAASFLSRTTAILAALFFMTSLGLAFIAGNTGQTTDIMEAPEISDVPLSSDDVSVSLGSTDAAAIEELPAVTDAVEKANAEVTPVVKDAGSAAQKAVDTVANPAGTAKE